MQIPFCRYCYDITMFFSSFDEAKEAYTKVSNILKNDLEMDIHTQKSGIYEGIKQNYLGYNFTKNKKEHQILAIKKKKALPQIYQHWSNTTIQRIDGNYHIINSGILNRKDFTLLFENDLGKKFEIASLHNMRSNLKYYERHHSSENLKNGISSFSEYITAMNEATNVTTLLTIEARARQLYYSLFHEIICDPAFEFTKRTRRPLKDPLNALISFGNVFLYNRVATEIQKTSLDIRIEFVHATNRRSQSLNLDIADLFKPLIVDRAIFTIINRHMIHTSEHFEETEDSGIYLNKDGKQIFINELENKVYQKQTEENQPRTYDTRIREEIHKIFRFVCYDEKYKQFKYN